MQALDLLACGCALLAIQLTRRGARQPPLRAVQDRRRHLQIARQFGGGGGGFRFLTLGLEKQLGLSEETFADRR